MTEYIDEYLGVVNKLPEDDYLAQYKRKLKLRKIIGIVFLGIYALLFCIPILFNLEGFLKSNNIVDLISLNTFGVFSFVFGFLFLVYGVKVRSGSSLYELPIIRQILGRRLSTQSTLDYFFGLAGKDELIVKKTISIYVRLNLMKSCSVTNENIRPLEDSIVSERFRQEINFKKGNTCA